MSVGAVLTIGFLFVCLFYYFWQMLCLSYSRYFILSFHLPTKSANLKLFSCAFQQTKSLRTKQWHVRWRDACSTNAVSYGVFFLPGRWNSSLLQMDLSSRSDSDSVYAHYCAVHRHICLCRLHTWLGQRLWEQHTRRWYRLPLCRKWLWKLRKWLRLWLWLWLWNRLYRPKSGKGLPHIHGYLLFHCCIGGICY